MTCEECAYIKRQTNYYDKRINEANSQRELDWWTVRLKQLKESDLYHTMFSTCFPNNGPVPHSSPLLA